MRLAREKCRTRATKGSGLGKGMASEQRPNTVLVAQLSLAPFSFFLFPKKILVFPQENPPKQPQTKISSPVTTVRLMLHSSITSSRTSRLFQGTLDL